MPMKWFGLIKASKVAHSKDSETSATRQASYVADYRGMRATIQKEAGEVKNSLRKVTLEESKAKELAAFIKPYGSQKVNGVDILSGLIWHDASVFSTSAWSAITHTLNFCGIDTFFSIRTAQGHLGMGANGEPPKGLKLSKAQPLVVVLDQIINGDDEAAQTRLLPNKLFCYTKAGAEIDALIPGTKLLKKYGYGIPKSELTDYLNGNSSNLSEPCKKGKVFLVNDEASDMVFLAGFWEDGSPISSLDLAISTKQFKHELERTLDNLAALAERTLTPIWLELCELSSSDISELATKKVLGKVSYANSKRRSADFLNIVLFLFVLLGAAIGFYSYQHHLENVQKAKEEAKLKTARELQQQIEDQKREKEKDLIAKNTLSSMQAQPLFKDFYGTTLFLLQSLPVNASVDGGAGSWNLSDWKCTADKLVNLKSGQLDIVSNCKITYTPSGSVDVDTFSNYLKQSSVVDGFTYKSPPSIAYDAEKNVITNTFSFDLKVAPGNHIGEQDKVQKQVQIFKSNMDLNDYRFIFQNAGEVSFKDPDTAKRLYKVNAVGTSYNPYQYIKWSLSFQLNDVRNNIQNFNLPSYFGLMTIKGNDKVITLEGNAYYEKK